MKITKSKIIVVMVILLSVFPFTALASVIDPEPDTFEPDDTLSEANSIVINDINPQSRTIDRVDDEDWVKFFGLVGMNYRIRVFGTGTQCDLVIGIFNKNGKLMKMVDMGLTGESETLEWTDCPLDNVYYIRIWNVEMDGFGEDAGYFLKLSTIDAPSAQINGVVSDAQTSLPLANVRIKTSGLGSAISGKENGFYRITHPDGQWKVYAYAEGYQRFYETFTLSPAEIKEFNISMAPVNLADVIELLQMLAGNEGGNIDFRNDISGNDRIGQEEAVYYMQVIAEIR